MYSCSFVIWVVCKGKQCFGMLLAPQKHCWGSKGSYSHCFKRQVIGLPKLQQLMPLGSQLFPKPWGELRKSVCCEGRPLRGNCVWTWKNGDRSVQHSPSGGLCFSSCDKSSLPGGWDRWKYGPWWWLVKCLKYWWCVFPCSLSHAFSGSFFFFFSSLFFLYPVLLVISLLKLFLLLPELPF